MGFYRLQELDMQIPDGWQDNSINAFALPGGADGAAASLVVTRDATAQERESQAFAKRHLEQAARQLRGFKLIDQSTITIAGQTALAVTFAWQARDNILVQQRQAFLAQRTHMLIFTLTARQGEFARFEDCWREAIQSIRLRTPNGAR